MKLTNSTRRWKSMKLKTIVASLVALGLSGCVLAMKPYMMDPSFQRDVMRYQVNKLDMILDRNQPGGFDQPCGWTCRINISGWMNTDAYLANKPPVFLGLNPAFNLNDLNVENLPVLQPTSGRASDLILNNANLFVDARVNNWVTANMSVVYTSLAGLPGSTGPYNIANSLFVYHPLNRTAIDTAYATIGNFQASPIYFRVGKEYIPFGAYDPYGFVTQENPTQLFTEITATAAQLGFIVPNGIYGSLYTFAGNPKISDGGSTRRIQNGGADLGWGWRWFNSKFNLDAGLTFPVAAHQSRVAIGYQKTTHLATFLPQRRIYADYMVNLAKWFDVGIAIFQDRDYNIGEGAITSTTGVSVPGTVPVLRPPLNTIIHAGATGNKSTVGQLRASIKFA